ncbi:memo-like protein-domain-containing protein [Lactarius quietus]|nr:memo-like protein-domain-containing protein [Lactarius quietus]
MSVRRATHADSWYTAESKDLNSDLSKWLDAVSSSSSYSPPIANCKAIIAPHAGYSYSGPTAAWAYKSISTTGIKRVFILGPSHHIYLTDARSLSVPNMPPLLGPYLSTALPLTS